MQDIYYPSKDGKNTVHACLWLPQGKAKAVVQLIHGMCEYAERLQKQKRIWAISTTSATTI